MPPITIGIANIPRMCLKANLRKAFDNILWDFIEGSLLALKFSNHWIPPIMGCIKEPYFTILIKGKFGSPKVSLKPVVAIDNIGHLKGIWLRKVREGLVSISYLPNADESIISYEANLIYSGRLNIFERTSPNS